MSSIFSELISIYEILRYFVNIKIDFIESLLMQVKIKNASPFMKTFHMMILIKFLKYSKSTPSRKFLENPNPASIAIQNMLKNPLNSFSYL